MKRVLMGTVLLMALVSLAEVRSAEIGFAGYTGSETLTDFPALIKLPDAVEGFSYAEAGEHGEQMWFTDANGTVLAHDIDCWNAEGKSYVWVKVPSLTAATKITFHWGAAAPAEKPAASGTWTGYTGVWHMNAGDSVTGALEPDASGNGLDATPAKHPLAGDRGEQLGPMPFGQIGNCILNQQRQNTRNALEVPAAYWDKMSNVQVMTIGGWFRLGRYVTEHWQRFFSAKNSNGEGVGWEAYTGNGSNNQISGCGAAGHKAHVTVPEMRSHWMHVQYVFNGTTVQIYANGALCGTVSTTAIKARTDGVGFVIGATPNYNDSAWCGYYDEVRLYNGVLSADRIKAEYDTSHDPLAFIKGRNVVAHHVDLYTSGYSGAETLSNLPVLVTFPDCVPGFRYEDAAADGSDIWFADADGNPLAADCSCWRDTHYSPVRSDFWVKVPHVTRSTKITVHWGGTPPANRPPATQVWQEYVGVWHMGTATGNPVKNEPDASGHGLDAVPNSANPAKLNEVTSRWSGQLYLAGQCTQIQSETGKLNGLQVPPYSDYIANPSKFTISGWFFADKANGYSRLFSAQKTNQENVGWEVWHNNGTKSLGMTGSKVNVTVNTDDFLTRWVHVLVVYDGATAKMYWNGRLIKSDSILAASARADGLGFTIGGNANFTDMSLYGCADEVRMYNGVQSADRVYAEVITQMRPTNFLRPALDPGAIHEELPTYCYRFDDADSWMKTSASFLYGQGEELLGLTETVKATRVPSPAGGALSTTGVGPYGTLNFGGGDWTCHVRAQTVALDGGVIWSLGRCDGANVGLLLLANGADGVSLVTATGLEPIEGSRLDASVPDAAYRFHDYAVVLRTSTNVAELYVDGVLKGALPHAGYLASNNNWQWLSTSGGNSSVGMKHGVGIRIEDVRFYRRALAAAELGELHQWLSTDSAKYNHYTATVTRDLPFEELEWTPARPAGGFTADDMLTVNFAAPGKSLYMWHMEKAAQLNVNGCLGAAPGAAGRIVEMCSYPLNWPISLQLANGAVYDANGFGNADTFDEPYALLGDGCAFANSRLAIGSDRSLLANGLVLAPGATAYVGSDVEMGLVGSGYYSYWIDLCNGRLVKRGSNNCWVANATVYGPGTLEVAEGKLTLFKTGFQTRNAELEVKSGATLEVQIASAVERLSGEGAVTVAPNVVLTVTESLAGTLNIASTAGSTNAVTVASGATLDLSQNTAPFVQPASLRYLGQVQVVPPGRKVYFGRKQLIAWAQPPVDEAVTFVSAGMTRPLQFSVEASGLWIDMSGTIIFVR